MGPELLPVTLTGDNPDDVEKILNALIPIYKERFDSDETDKVNNQIDRVKASMAKTEKEIKNSASQLDGPGRDLRHAGVETTGFAKKISGSTIPDRPAAFEQMRKDEIDKADFKNRLKNPAALVKDLDVLEKLEQDIDLRAPREELAKLNRDIKPASAFRAIHWPATSSASRLPLSNEKSPISRVAAAKKFAKRCKKRKCRSLTTPSPIWKKRFRSARKTTTISKRNCRIR